MLFRSCSVSGLFACVQTSPISFVARGKGIALVGISPRRRNPEEASSERESLALLKQARLMSEDADINVGISKSDMVL